MHIRKGDNVIVLTGADRGKKGTISRVLASENKVVIEGVNVHKKHHRARKAGQKGQLIDIAMPVALSNVALVEGGKPVRTGKKLVGEQWVRISRKSGKEI